MKDPPRWIEAEGLAPGRVRELFQSASPTPRMTPFEWAKSAAQVAQIAATPAGVSPLIFLKNFVATILGIATAGALFGGGTGLEIQHCEIDVRPTPNVSVVAHVENAAPAQQELVANATSSSGQTVTPALPKGLSGLVPGARLSEKSPSDANSRAEARHRKDSQPVDNSLARETALLEEARALLRTNPSEALARITEHRKSFPQGQLKEDREFLAIDVLIRLGNKAVARARAMVLLKRAGSDDAYEARVRRKLDEIDSMSEAQ